MAAVPAFVLAIDSVADEKPAFVLAIDSVADEKGGQLRQTY